MTGPWKKRRGAGGVKKKRRRQEGGTAKADLIKNHTQRSAAGEMEGGR